jgi:hypothetical protein
MCHDIGTAAHRSRAGRQIHAFSSDEPLEHGLHSPWLMKLVVSSIFLIAAAINVGCSAETACYSPTQNLDSAYDEGSVGCECDDGSAGQCIADSEGRNVALVCNGGQWTAVEDGPCEPQS